MGLLEIGVLPPATHRPWPLPRRPWVMTQRWERLLFAHWPLPLETLRPLIPSSLTLDTFDGRAWLGITPFTLAMLRPRGTPTIPGLAPFHEINVRTYVRLGDRPGVFFFSLDAGSPLAVAGARVLYALPYRHARFTVTGDHSVVAYRCQRTERRWPPAEFDARYHACGPVATASPGTLPHWLTERYCLYAVTRRGQLRRAEIHHRPWPLQPAEAEIRTNTMTAGLGIELPPTAPIVHFAERLDVHVWLPTLPGRREIDGGTRSTGQKAASRDPPRGATGSDLALPSNMAILQALIALVTRSLGRITSSIFGWAVVALFGQTAPAEKTLLSALVGAAAAWPILLLGIAMPKVAVFVLGFVPLPDWIPSWTVRVIWIALAAIVPLTVGLTMAGRRPRGSALSHRDPPAAEEAALTRLLRGFPTTLGIAAAFFVVFVTVPALRVASLVRRRVDVQVPLLTDREHYHAVADQIARTLTERGFEVHAAQPGWWMTVPSRILLTLGGPAFRAHVPERLAYFRGDRLEVALYPNGLLLRGSAQDTAWAHGVVVEDLTAAPALQTFDPRAQDLERQIRRVWSVYAEQPAAHARSLALSSRVQEIAAELGGAPLTYDEWQIVYRQTLQLSRALGGAPQLLEATANGRANGRANGHRTTEEKMMSLSTSPKSRAREANARELSNRELLGEITGKASLLVRKEIELAKAEIRTDVQAQLGTIKAFGVAAVAALLGLNLLLVAGVLALGLKIAAWLAALIGGGALILIAVIVGYVGYKRMVTNPLALTRQTLKEDVQWMKERLA